MKSKYPRKKLVIILDNLWAYKSSLIIDEAENDEKVELLYTPSNSPE